MEPLMNRPSPRRGASPCRICGLFRWKLSWCSTKADATVSGLLQTTSARDSQSPVLVALADTFIGGMGHPGSPIRVAATMQDTFDRLPSKNDRRQLRIIVGVLGRRSGTFLLTGRMAPFHHWSREQRVAVMSSWSTSRPSHSACSRARLSGLAARSRNPFAMPSRPSSRSRSSVGWFSKVCSPQWK